MFSACFYTIVCSPGQGFAKQGLYSTGSPISLQFCPPNFGSGFLQSRSHVSKPSPQLTLHLFFNDHLP